VTTDYARPPDVQTEGRALADQLKREALEDLPVLLALWEPDEAGADAA
jgi:hypothetical protein